MHIISTVTNNSKNVEMKKVQCNCQMNAAV